MKNYLNLKKFYLVIYLSFFLVLPSSIFAKAVPASFADLAEKLMPSVVNISATRVVETRPQSQFPFQFPPGSPFEEFLKNLISSKPHKKENQLHLDLDLLLVRME